MALELIAAVVAAFGAAGIALMLRKLSGGRLPRWLMPVAAGVGLIGTTVVLEYGWYARVSAELPEGVIVVWEDQSPQALRPWTFVAPLVTRFTALDLREGAAHPARDDLRLLRIYNFARWQNVTDAMMVFDCRADARVLLTETVSIGEDGTLNGADWAPAPEGDRMQATACGEG